MRRGRRPQNVKNVFSCVIPWRSTVLRYEINQDCKRAVRFVDETTVEVDGHHGAKQFVFDSVFSEEHGQENIFEDTRNLVQSALDG